MELFAPHHGMSRGVHVRVRSESEEMLVSLGPAWFIDSQIQLIEEGDSVEVVGSEVVYFNEHVLMAGRITNGHKSLRLRDPDGRPLWGTRKRLGEGLRRRPEGTPGLGTGIGVRAADAGSSAMR